MSRVAAALCLLAAGVTALAAWWALRAAPLQNPTSTMALHAQLDQDGDGQVTMDELSLTLPERPPAHIYDLDKDQRLSPNELEAALVEIDPTWFYCGGFSRDRSGP